jgi:hypothetical protein
MPKQWLRKQCQRPFLRVYGNCFATTTRPTARSLVHCLTLHRYKGISTIVGHYKNNQHGIGMQSVTYSCHYYSRGVSTTVATASVASPRQSARRLGFGLGQWKEESNEYHLYKSMIETSLFQENSITNTIEIGFLMNHDVSFVKAYRTIVHEQSTLNLQPPLGEAETTPSTLDDTNQQTSPYAPPKINVLWRLGYRLEENDLVDIGSLSSSLSSSLQSSTTATVDDEKHDLEAPDTSLSFLNDDDDSDMHSCKKPFLKKHIEDVVQVDEVPTSKIKYFQPPKLIHNISPEYIHHVLSPNGNNDRMHMVHPDIKNSQEPELYSVPPLIKLKQDFPEYITLTIMLHNPETQLSRYYTAQKIQHPAIANVSPQEFLESKLVSAFQTLQSYCGTNPDGIFISTKDDNAVPPLIDGYGVMSNGLSLLNAHPLHLSHNAILNAAKRVYTEDVFGHVDPNFHAIQLPANALETNGIHVAKQIQAIKQEEVCRNKDRPTYISNLLVHALRPLTCYSDGGIGTSDRASASPLHPFTLVDYKVEVKKNKQAVTQWTNHMQQPPLSYNAAYQRTIQLFDAQEILEAQAERRRKKKETKPKSNAEIVLRAVDKDRDDYLTDEERETLHGCQLLQNMIRRLDSVLENARSVKTHEVLLGTEVIPTLRDKFESYDENTSYALQAYFTSYGKTMEYYVAKNTRQLLLHGEPNRKTNATTVNAEITPPTYDAINDLPDDKRLQEFGIELLFKQSIRKNNIEESVSSSALEEKPDVAVFDIIMVGLSNLEETCDTINIFKDLTK